MNSMNFRLPRWVRYVFLSILPRFLLMTRPKSGALMSNPPRKKRQLTVHNPHATRLENHLQDAITSIHKIANNVSNRLKTQN